MPRWDWRGARASGVADMDPSFSLSRSAYMTTRQVRGSAAALLRFPDANLPSQQPAAVGGRPSLSSGWCEVHPALTVLVACAVPAEGREERDASEVDLRWMMSAPRCTCSPPHPPRQHLALPPKNPSEVDVVDVIPIPEGILVNGVHASLDQENVERLAGDTPTSTCGWRWRYLSLVRSTRSGSPFGRQEIHLCLLDLIVPVNPAQSRGRLGPLPRGPPRGGRLLTPVFNDPDPRT